jgi:hypothetical protein
VQSLPDYRRLLEAAGFRVVSIEDMTEWGPILQQRLARFQAMRQAAEAAGTPAGDDAFRHAWRTQSREAHPPQIP